MCSMCSLLIKTIVFSVKPLCCPFPTCSQLRRGMAFPVWCGGTLEACTEPWPQHLWEELEHWLRVRPPSNAAAAAEADRAAHSCPWSSHVQLSGMGRMQWYKVTTYFYLSSVLEYNDEVLVLYCCILYFYSTTFQREILYSTCNWL